MKKFILILSVLFSFNVFSQTEKIESDTVPDMISKVDTAMYQYRISFSQVTTIWSGKNLEADMLDLFKSQVVFNDQLKQYIFTSSVNVDRFEVLRLFTGYDITYFKKIPIITTN